MSAKRLSVFAMVTAMMLAGAAFAQKAPTRGTHLTVSKTTDNPESGMFTSIQAAVNAAQPGQVIEILDEGVYEEQVTIYGVDVPDTARILRALVGPGRPAIKGNKNSITIRYVPLAGITARPTIKWQDTYNRSPKDFTEARTDGDTLGSSNNFATNGAVRIIRASNIVLEGLIIDGGGAAPWRSANVWNGEHPVVHGNASVAVTVSGNVQIRDCELKNSYIGIAGKDRNTGGVFGNPNPHDNDKTVPMSGFGQTGNHLFEYNKIGENHLGFFFESSWDRGSTIRYNLIYNNTYQSTTTMPASSGNDGIPGGIVFKDCYLSPVAIYNNTFNNNHGDIVGIWQVGYQHLIFNNIFGKGASKPTGGAYIDGNSLNLIAMFPNRMKHCVFTAMQVQVQAPTATCNRVRVTDVRFADNTFKQLGWNDGYTLCPAGDNNSRIVAPGAPLAARDGQPAFPGDANLKWLEMNGAGTGATSLPVLFKSVNPASPDFLVPDWDAQEVKDFIRNAGWPANAGIGGTGPGGVVTNADGSIADLGAIPFSGKRPCGPGGPNWFPESRARISAFSVVDIAGGEAIASITVNNELGSPIVGNMTLKLLRWVAPIPLNVDSYGNNGTVVPATAVRAVTPVAGSTISAGSQTFNITLPAGAVPNYGFFEIVLEGKNADNKTVVTDVGFLPYRQLDYELKITVYRGTTEVTTVRAGETGLTMKVEAIDKSGGTPKAFTGSGSNFPLKVEYKLQSDPAARIWRSVTPVPNNALTQDSDLRTGTAYNKTYNPVFFTKSPNNPQRREVISASGLWCQGDCDLPSVTNRLAFHGVLPITVLPGDPDKVVFVDPIPNSQLPQGANPTTISANGYTAIVEVRDKYENAVDQAVPVTLRSEDPGKGDVKGPATVSTGVADGSARFEIEITGGGVGEIFDIIATASVPGKASDTSSLRIARNPDGLRVMFVSEVTTNGQSDWKADVNDERNDRIDALTDEWVPVWIKAIALSPAIDTVLTGKTGFVCVRPTSPDIKLSLSETGADSKKESIAVPLAAGVAKVWVSSEVDVDDAKLEVFAMTAGNCESPDKTLGSGTSNPISFAKPLTNILGAKVFADGNGNAEPDRVEIYYGRSVGTIKAPTSVKLRWPDKCVDAVSANSITLEDTLVTATFASGFFEKFYTAPVQSKGILIVTDGDTGLDEEPRVDDGIGPLIAGSMSMPLCAASSLVFAGPMIIENLRFAAGVPDTIEIQITEPLADYEGALAGRSIMVSPDSLGTYRELNVVNAQHMGGTRVKLALDPAMPAANRPQSGEWVKFNKDHFGIVDISGNSPHKDNRPVQMWEKEVAPDIIAGWYTGDNMKGTPDFAYIVLNKKLTGKLDLFFLGSVFDFKWGSAESVWPAVTSAFRVIPDVDTDRGYDTLVIDLSVAFPSATGLNAPIRTSGPMDVKITFGAGGLTADWGSKNGILKDQAKPVLVRAVLRVGSVGSDGAGRDIEYPDTLVITYSEPLNESILKAIAQPVIVASKENTANQRLPDLVYMQHTPVGTGWEVRYIINMNYTWEPYPVSGDLVWINSGANVTDNAEPGNVQNIDQNRHVPLEIVRGPIRWNVKVKNNPFKSGSGNGRDSITIVLDPKSKGGWVQMESRIMLLSNMGNVVVDTLIKFAPTENGKLSWTWRGRNKKGRYVGTGTYLFKAVTKASVGSSYQEVMSQPMKRQDDVVRSIGFVRGKGQ